MSLSRSFVLSYPEGVCLRRTFLSSVEGSLGVSVLLPWTAITFLLYLSLTSLSSTEL